MEDKKNKRKIFKRIGAIVGAVAITIVAFSLPFLSKFGSNFNNRSMIAYADSVDTDYYFRSSDTYYIGVWDLNGYAYSNSMLMFSGETKFSSNVLTTRMLTYVADWNRLENQYHLITNVDLYSKSGLVQEGSNLTFFNIPYDTPLQFHLNYSSSNTAAMYFCFVYAESGFNSNVYKIDLGLSDTNEWQTSPRGDGLKFFNIAYYDVNNNYMKFSFLVGANFYYNSRTYYIQNPEVFTQNQYYNEGYSSGYSSGYAEGEVAGYKDGYGVGNGVGYNNGYSAGVEAGGNYTFFSLISAVIDAPVQAFMGLFNFELLGVNLAGFFTGLLTLAFIVTAVRLLL